MLAPDLAHIQHIRIGTKAVAYWPQRFVTDKDADDLLRLFETVVRSGRNLALMGHYNHPAELRHPIAQQALRRIIATGATVRIQAPLIRHINENPADWAELWTTGVRLGAVPYYMFVERDTGPSDYFKLPLARAYDIFQQAYRTVSGLARTVRGPSMSAFPGRCWSTALSIWPAKGLRPAVPAGTKSGLGAPPVLRPVRSAGNLAGRIAAGVREKRFSSSRTASPVADDSHCAGRRVALGQARAQRPGGDRMSGPTADALYEVYALRYATHAERRSAANYLGEDPHDNAPMPLDFYVWVIRNPARTLLVDTGFSADMAVRRGRRYLASPVDLLKQIGIAAESVEDIVVTHMHYDHAGNIAAFPKARLHLQEKEMAYCTGRCMCHAAMRSPSRLGTWPRPSSGCMPASWCSTTAMPRSRPASACT